MGKPISRRQAKSKYRQSMSKRKRVPPELMQKRLELFSDQEEDQYEERKVGTDYYVKQFDGNTGRWRVAVYSYEAFWRYKGERDSHLAHHLDE